MELISAIIVFIIGNYLKLMALVNPIYSLWKYYSDSEHLYVIIMELILDQSLVTVMFASLALTRMNCERLANYFMVPVFLALIYLNVAAYQVSADQLTSGPGVGHLLAQPETNDSSSRELSLSAEDPKASWPIEGGSSGDNSLAMTSVLAESKLMDSIEFGLHESLASVALVQLLTNVYNLRTNLRQNHHDKPQLVIAQH